MNPFFPADNLLKEAPKGLFIVFKHSFRCSISSVAKSRLEKSPEIFGFCPVYLLDVVKDRPHSLAIAEKYQVTHESPQILIIKDEKCIYHASHFDIESQEILNFLNNEN